MTNDDVAVVVAALPAETANLHQQLVDLAAQHKLKGMTLSFVILDCRQHSLTLRRALLDREGVA